MKKYYFFLAAACLVFSNAFSEQKEVSLKYDLMLKDAFDEKGSGRIIPVAIERAVETDPSLTPDGKFLVYSSDRENGNFDIYLRRMSGIETLRLTSHASRDNQCAVSPDGRKIVFVSDRDDPSGDLYYCEFNPDSMIAGNKSGELDSSLKNLTSVSDYSGILRMIKDSDPVWSPSSDLIAFSSMREGKENIYTVKPSSGEIKKITEAGGVCPSFSPDGKKIIFVSYRNSANGEIFTRDLATGRETSVLSCGGLVLFPAYTDGSDNIIYTLINDDSNHDGKIDLKDRSVIMMYNLAQKESFSLAASGGSSFKARYFSAFSLKFYNSSAVNYPGVILYSEQTGSNININMLPSYGFVPKRKNAREQYLFAISYFEENGDDGYIENMLRTYHYHHTSSAKEDRYYIIRSLAKAVLSARNSGAKDDADALMRILEKYGMNDEYAEAEKRIISGKIEHGELNGVSDKDGKIMVFEDAADYYAERGSNADAYRLYSAVTSKNPDYKYIEEIYLKEAEAALKSGKEVNSILGPLEKVFLSGTSVQQEKASVIIISALTSPGRTGFDGDLFGFITAKTEEYEKTLNSEKADFRKTSGHKLLISTLKFCTAFHLNSRGRVHEAESVIKSELSALKKASKLFYLFNRLLADINRNNADEEEKYLFSAASNYLTRWKEADIYSTAEKLFEYYETKGSEFMESGNYKEAEAYYSKEITLVSYLYKRGKFGVLYDRFAPKAHISYIEAAFASRGSTTKALSDIEREYLKELNIARMDFDKAHIYGLAYIYSKKGELYFTSGESGGVNFAEDLSKAVENADWALFMDDNFADAYLLKGWVYHFVDMIRSDDSPENSASIKKLSVYFGDYLFEKAREIYKRAIDSNNESAFPEKEGSLYLNLGNANFVLKNYSEALKNYDAAGKYKISHGSEIEEAVYRYHLSYCCWQNGHLSRAKDEMEKVYSIYKSLSAGVNASAYSYQLLCVYRYFALFEFMRGGYTEALKWYSEILSHSARFSLGEDKGSVFHQMALCMEALGRYDEALYYTDKADKEISGRSDLKTGRYFKVFFFYFLGPVPVWNYGEGAVIGTSRIPGALDNFQRKLLSLSIRERIYAKTGNFPAAGACLNEKLSLVKGSDSALYAQAYLSALNNLGTNAFKMDMYDQAEIYFNNAWKESDRLQDSRAVFAAVKNLASLICFLSERGKKNVNDIDALLARIEAYKSVYEKKRFDEELPVLKARAESFKRDVSPKEIDDLKSKISSEAAVVYIELDIASAFLSLEKAEMEYAKNGSAGRASYSNAKKLFSELLKDNDRSGDYAVRIMLNSALCSWRTGKNEEAAFLYGEAVKKIKTGKYDNLIPQVYLSCAGFARKTGNAAAAENYYSTGVSAVENFPQMFADSHASAEDLFAEYAGFLSENGKNEKAFGVLERLSSVKRVWAFFTYSPVFSYEEANVKLSSAKEIFGDSMLLRADSDSTGHFDDKKREIRNKINSLPGGDFGRYFAVEKSAYPKSATPYYSILRDGEILRVWTSLDGRISYSEYDPDKFIREFKGGFVRISKDSLDLNLKGAVYIVNLSDTARLEPFFDADKSMFGSEMIINGDDAVKTALSLFSGKYSPVSVILNASSFSEQEAILFSEALLYSGASNGIVKSGERRLEFSKSDKIFRSEAVSTEKEFDKAVLSGNIREAKKISGLYRKSGKASKAVMGYFNARIENFTGSSDEALGYYPLTSDFSDFEMKEKAVSFGVYLFLKSGRKAEASEFMKKNKTYLEGSLDYEIYRSILSFRNYSAAGSDPLLAKEMLINLFNRYAVIRSAPLMKSADKDDSLGTSDKIFASEKMIKTDSSGRFAAAAAFAGLKALSAQHDRKTLKYYIGSELENEFKESPRFDRMIFWHEAAKSAEESGFSDYAEKYYQKCASVFPEEPVFVLLKTAELRTLSGRYSASDEILSAPVFSGNVQALILRTENALFSGKSNADSMIDNMIKALSSGSSAAEKNEASGAYGAREKIYHLLLLKAHSTRLKITASGKKSLLGKYESDFLSALNAASNDLSVIRKVRKDLFMKGIDFLIMLNFSERKYAEALYFAEIKKQIEAEVFVSSHSSDEGISSEFRSMKKTDTAKCVNLLAKDRKLYYNYVLPALPIREFQKNMPGGSVVFYMTESEGDILLWEIREKSMNGFRLTDGYSTAKKINESDEPVRLKIGKLIGFFRNAFRIKKEERMYFVSSAKLDQIPFEMIFADNFTAYLPSIASASVRTGQTEKYDSAAVYSDDQADHAAVRQSQLKSVQSAAFIMIRSVIPRDGGEFFAGETPLSHKLKTAETAVLIRKEGEPESFSSAAEYSFSAGVKKVVIIDSVIKNANENIFLSAFLNNLPYSGFADAYMKALAELSRSRRFGSYEHRTGFRFYQRGFD